MWFRWCENAVALSVENPTKRFCWWIVVSCVHTKFHTSTRTSVQGYRVWMTTKSSTWISVFLRPCHSNSPLSADKTCYLVMMLAKVLRTQVHMSSRSSVQNHWHFEHYLQSLCLPVLHAAWNRTKIVPWSFPMSLFLGSTVWSSLLILRISWHAVPAALLSQSLWMFVSKKRWTNKPHGSYRLIGKLTAFLQLQEFSLRKHTQVASSPSDARLSSRNYRGK
jgi:hypothetical protein